MNKNVLIMGLAACLVISFGWIYWLEREPGVDSTSHDEQKSGLANTELTDRSASRLASLESDLAQVSDQVTSLHELIRNTGEEQGINEHVAAAEDVEATVEPPLDPFSPEGIAKADALQNGYISQVDGLYQLEEVSPEWADTIETKIHSRLSDLYAFQQQFNPRNRSPEASAYVVPDISIASFNCRSQLCSTEILSGTLEEMLSYQNYMVEQTKTDLPSMVFSTIESDGNKFRMRAFLARDGYDFPVPTEP